MPSNDGPVCVEKIPIPNDIKPSTSAQALKKNAQDSIQMLAAKQATSQYDTMLQPGKSIMQLKGQKWSQLFDFDKAMQQLRVAEYNLYQNKCGTGRIVAGSMNVKKCNAQLRQVQTLEGCDMHYFGIAPKQKALNAVVCNLCSGVYTAIGFSNHMLLRHPEAWHSASTEVDIAEIQNMLGAVESQTADEHVKPLMPPPPLPPPRALKTAATSSALYPANAKHKNKGTGSSRARSKNKHQNNTDAAISNAKQQADSEAAAAVAVAAAAQATKSGTPERQTSSHSKSGKKSSSTTPTTTSSPSKESATPKAKSSYSTSSYSSYNNALSETKPTLKIQIKTKEIREKSANTTTSTSKRKVYNYII